MPVKLIASDLDGTLFDVDHRPAPRTVVAVNAAVDAGIVVVAVTGRSYFSGAPLAISTGARLDWFIGSNGGHRLDYATNVLEERLTFTSEAVDEICDGVDAALEKVGFAWEIGEGLAWNQVFVDMAPTTQSRPRIVMERGDHRISEVGKIFVAHPEVTSVDLVDLVQPHVHADLNVTTSGAKFVEITPAGADKGSALARLCGNLGIERSEVVAFGDNQNDLTMLDWAGRGVAMGNALGMVKAVADEVAAPNHEHGVAQVIEAMLGSRSLS